MYKAYLNNNILFFDTSCHDPAFSLTSASVTMEAGAAGSFTFVIPPENQQYGNFHRVTDFVDVYRDDKLIFAGRVYSVRQTFNTSYEIECEGLLAILTDSIFRPELFDGTLHDLVEAIIDSHNSEVESDKFIELYRQTIPDANVYRDYMNHETSIARLQDLNASFGGYMMLEKLYNPDYAARADYAKADISVVDNTTGARLRFSWLQDFDSGCDQEIELGSNITNISRTQTAADVITVLIPVGAEDENGNRLNIKSVNGGLDYIEAPAAYINEFGYIVGTHTWDDVTTAAQLLAKAREYLNAALLPVIQLSVSAVDLADAGYDIESFRIGQKISVTSAPHGIDHQLFNCVSQSLDLLHPGQNRLTLGKEQIGYVQSQRANSTESVLQRVASTFVSKSSLQTAIERVTATITGNEGGYVVIHDSNGDGEPDEILILDTPDIQTAVRVWRWNSSGLGYSSTGYNGTYGLAMTMDGEIVANYITAGTLDGAILKALSVTAQAIAAGAITAEKIASGAITTDKLDALSITAAKIAAGAVTADKVNIADLFAQAITASNFTITGGSINITANSSSQNKIVISYGSLQSSMSPNNIGTYNSSNGLRTAMQGGGLWAGYNDLTTLTNVYSYIGAYEDSSSTHAGRIWLRDSTSGNAPSVDIRGEGTLAVYDDNAHTLRTYIQGHTGQVHLYDSSATERVWLNATTGRVNVYNSSGTNTASLISDPGRIYLAENMFKQVEHTLSLTVPANSYVQNYIQLTATSGYEISGFGGFYLGNGNTQYLNVYRASIDASNRFWYGVYNTSSSSVSTTLYYYTSEAHTK